MAKNKISPLNHFQTIKYTKTILSEAGICQPNQRK